MDGLDVPTAGAESDVESPEAGPSLEEGAGELAAESRSFARCAQCARAEGVDRSAGTLVCATYNMRVNAEADEIPDDCLGFVALEGEAAGA